MENDGKDMESDVQEESGQGGQTRLTLNFKSVLERTNFNEFVELIAKEHKVTKGEALGIATALLQKQISIEGYGAGRPEYTNQYYNLIEAQAKSLLTGFKNALENCDKGVLAIQTECNRQIEQLKEDLEFQNSAHAEALAELSEHNSRLETSNAELFEANSHIRKENEALVALKTANEKAAAAWESERQSLNERIVSLQSVTEENSALLKERESLKTEIGELKKEMADKEHRYEIDLKESEIKHQKVLADTVAAKTAEAEEKIKQYFEPVVADFKTRLAGANEQLEAERKNVDTVRAEERAKASEETKRLEELLKQVQSMAMSTKVESEESPKKKGRRT